MTGEGRKEFDGHSGQTLEEILALEENFDQESLFSAIWSALWLKYDRVGPDGLSQEEKIVLAVMTLDFEVHNGGYHQFFLNSSREFSPIIVDALQRVGCTKAAGLTQQAIDLLKIEGPLTGEAVFYAARGLDFDGPDNAELYSIDEQFFDLVAGGGYFDQLFDFVRENRGRITVGE